MKATLYCSLIKAAAVGIPLLAGSMPALAQAPVSAHSAPSPRIQFAETQHDFGRMMVGTLVKHQYLFTNTGNATLILSNVHASCGCTATADWTREVAPGGTGRIPIQFNSTSFLGNVSKSVTVTCNDPVQPMTVLQLKAEIWRPVEVQPAFAVIHVPPGAEGPATTTVSVRTSLEEPLWVEPPQSTLPAFQPRFVTNAPGRDYQLIIETVPPLPPGHTQGQITFKTSSTSAPVVTVPVIAVVQPSVSVSPAQITLPAQMPPQPVPYVITIRSQSSQPFTVTNAAVNASGVEVAIREVEAGRHFQLQATFPPGYELPPGERLEITAHTSHPSQPVVRVPVTQSPRPAIPPRL